MKSIFMVERCTSYQPLGVSSGELMKIGYVEKYPYTMVGNMDGFETLTLTLTLTPT